MVLRLPGLGTVAHRNLISVATSIVLLILNVSLLLDSRALSHMLFLPSSQKPGRDEETGLKQLSNIPHFIWAVKWGPLSRALRNDR